MNKPRGISSNGFLSAFKRKTGLRKCGYAGTLDPFATGVLVVGCGKATKLLGKISDMNKDYEAVAEFGMETDSGDLTGAVLDRCDKIPSAREIECAIEQSFTGAIQQTPPVYSALKLDGKRLCDLARFSKRSIDDLAVVAEKKTREVSIFQFNVSQLEDRVFKFQISCSKGTYIRKLLVDLARSLNSLATVTELKRTGVGSFCIEKAIELEQIHEFNAAMFAIRASEI